MYKVLLILIGIFMVSGCGMSGDGGDESSTPNVNVGGEVMVDITAVEFELPDSPYYGPTPLRERLTAAEIIVRVRFQSVAPVGAYVHEGGDHYTYADLDYFPALDFTFNALEYLRGSGGSTIVARAYGMEEESREWGNPADTQEAERIAREQMLPFRDKRWDDREAIVLLRPPIRGGEPYFFGNLGIDHRDDGSSPLMYWLTVADDFYVTWLPEAEAEESNSGRTLETDAEPEQYFFLDDPGATTTTRSARTTRSSSDEGSAAPRGGTRTVSKTSLRSLIRKIDTVVASYGGDASDIRTCLSQGAAHERWLRNQIAAGRPIGWTREHHVGSGLPAGTTMEWRLLDLPPDEIERDWFAHGDAALFNVEKTTVTTVRPLPLGEYLTYYGEAPKGSPDCGQADYSAKQFGYAVTVTAPAGTLAESFFDPYALPWHGSGHHRHDHGGHTISWQAGRVTADLTIDVTGHALDFIGLDGTHDAVAGRRRRRRERRHADLDGTITQPWSAGTSCHAPRPQARCPHADAYPHIGQGPRQPPRISQIPHLIGTDRQTAPTPTPIPTDRPVILFLDSLDATVLDSLEMEVGDVFWVSVRALNLSRSASYTIELTRVNDEPAGGVGIVFHYQACGYTPQSIDVSSGNTSYARTMAVKLCTGTGGTVTAVLKRGNATLATSRPGGIHASVGIDERPGAAPGGCRTRDGVVFTAPTWVPECPLPRRCISQIPHLIGTDGVTDCFLGHGGGPYRVGLRACDSFDGGAGLWLQ